MGLDPWLIREPRGWVNLQWPDAEGLKVKASDANGYEMEVLGVAGEFQFRPDTVDYPISGYARKYSDLPEFDVQGRGKRGEQLAMRCIHFLGFQRSAAVAIMKPVGERFAVGRELHAGRIRENIEAFGGDK